MTEVPQRIHGNRARYYQRVADAWAMRVRGAEWATIASALGYSSPQAVIKAVRVYAGSLPRIESTDALRTLWRERLESLWPMAVRDVESGRPGGTRAAVAIAQRAAALDGLDSPIRLEVGPADPRFEEIVQAALRGMGVAPVVEAEVLELDVVDADELGVEEPE